jgi:4'-phosphopantetheinyl transferase
MKPRNLIMPDDHQPLSVESGESFKWLETSGFPVLEVADIHVWSIPLIALPADITEAAKTLSLEEQQRASNFRFPADYRRLVLRRAWLRRLLAALLRVAPEEIRIETGTHGKPFLASPYSAAHIRFNCSHSGDWALIAVSCGRELGVDLERHRQVPEALDLARQFLSHAEWADLVELPAEQQTEGFFNCWTRKEAFLKALGFGLAWPLNRFAVSLVPGEPPALLHVDGEPDAPRQWLLHSLAVAPGYSAALAFADPSARVIEHG